MKNKKVRMAIATVKFKMQNSDSRSLMKWKPESVTRRYLYICNNYNEMAVRFDIEKKASALAMNLESKNEGLRVSFSYKIEAKVIDDVEIMGL